MKDRFVRQDKPVFHTLESENPTFLMTTPAEKPSLKCFFYFFALRLQARGFRQVVYAVISQVMSQVDITTQVGSCI